MKDFAAIERAGTRDGEHETFWISRDPVSVEEYARFCLATGYVRTSSRMGMANYEQSPDAVKLSQRLHVSVGELPMKLVSWHDAVAFCHRAGVRLPTSSELRDAGLVDRETVFPSAAAAAKARGPDMRIRSVGYEWTESVEVDPGIARIDDIWDDEGSETKGLTSDKLAVVRYGPLYARFVGAESTTFEWLAPKSMTHRYVGFRVVRC